MPLVETELKFQVDARRRAGLRRAVGTARAATLPLQALYFDTADRRLAGAGMALRLRREGPAWVQTLKGRGDGLMQRLEHEVPLPPQVGEPALDPARHAGTPAGDALARLLADGAPLQQAFGTDIERLHRRLRTAGATVEIAFDQGRIVAGERELAVCEIEFELIAGPPAALLALAERWALRHGLWLDVRTKAERGWRLALGVDRVPAVKASLPPLPASPAGAFAAMLQSALAQALPNAAEVAGDSGGAETLHQLRVGLRRLRTVLRLFAPWSADAAAALALEQRWREPFARLGAARDTDVLDAWLRPALAAAGAPPLPAHAAHAVQSPGELLRDPAFSALALQTLQLALAMPAAAADAPLPAAARAVLRPGWKRLRADASAFADAAVDDQHRTRKRLKRLRYATEFLQPVLPAKAARRALAGMRDALDALGTYNDVLVAQALLREPGGDDAGTAFALGWLAAQRGSTLAAAARALARLARVDRFWP